MEFKRDTLPFRNDGINLTQPVDRIPPGKHRVLKNVRRNGDNHTSGRLGLVQQAAVAAGGPVHSIYSWNDPIPNPSGYQGSFRTHARAIGIGSNLYVALADTNPTTYAQSDPTNFLLSDTGYSGKPLSFVTASSQFSPRPWVFVGDFNKTHKISSANGSSASLTMGIAPPNFAPTIAIGSANPDGPDIGATGVPYVYRFRARADSKTNTGCVSNVGPPVRDANGLSPSSVTNSPPPSNIVITVPAQHPDPQVAWLDVYRFGGSLPVWKFIGTVNNVAGATITDIYNDEDIASNPEAEFDDNQPWLTLDVSRTGTCNITSLGTGKGAILTITGGDTLRPYDAVSNPFYPLGNTISVNGTSYTFYRAPDSATTVELVEDAPSITGATWFLQTPEMMHQPLPCMFGPFGGGIMGIFIFGVGDSLRPGALYWTKGNHPESSPGTNVLDITSSSEPLMNGVIYNGNPFVFSTERLFAVYPTLGQISDFAALEVPNSKGLFARWGLCATPYGIVFIAKDGIYITQGGTPVSLTDEDLYPIFPHENTGTSGGVSDGTQFPFVDGGPNLVTSSFVPPDFSQPDAMYLEFGDGLLYFGYIDLNGNRKQLVGQFDAAGRFIGWISEDSSSSVSITRHYYETVQDNNINGVTRTQMLVGTSTGLLAVYGAPSDLGIPIAGQIRTAAIDLGDPRPRKMWGDVEIDIDSACEQLTADVGFDNYSYLSSTTSTSLNLHGRHRAILDINSGLGQYAYNIGLDITWSSSSAVPTFYYWSPSYVPKVEVTALRVTDWTDDGYQGAKFVQGFVLRCDTLGATRSFDVQSDGGVVQQSFTVSASNEQEIAFSFTTPFITHLLRLHPTDSNFWRVHAIRWIWEPAPELTGNWITQQTTHDFQGWWSHRDAYIPVISTANVTLTVTLTGNPTASYSYTLPSTSGVYNKLYAVLSPMKCLAAVYSLTSPAGFRLFQKDLEVRVKQWGSVGPYVSKTPAGDLSRMNGARI
jgi:hypothetical protein